ncbi:hypothetical protein DL546_002224 [Coniochaeta pulveracea]|uniref:Uncharacterized protein n=1 Tax=Coniochaeta pulveracea TaxID=177199 RepID=A0A420Y0F4_9PEZI|nr:hypothetical protein DL546_002224 [Coniochaeta pulveracea]RKU41240.1 hypothetical protein DL546_002224 [Coniochaeta pulveracea]
MSSNDELRQIAAEQERGLNTYQAKTGRARGHDLEEVSGVDSRAPKNFPGADLRYGDDLTTNASYDRRIPEEEGGTRDDKGRLPTGRQFEGAGGPERKDELNNRDRGGNNDQDVAPKSALGSYGERSTHELRGYEQLDQGRDAAETNVGRISGMGKSGGVGGGKFKGADYEDPEFVPDQRSAQGNIPP